MTDITYKRWMNQTIQNLNIACPKATTLIRTEKLSHKIKYVLETETIQSKHVL